jgi:hypothetical protein
MPPLKVSDPTVIGERLMNIFLLSLGGLEEHRRNPLGLTALMPRGRTEGGLLTISHRKLSHNVE